MISMEKGILGFGLIILVLVVLWVAITWLVVWTMNKTKTPLEIIKEKYAMGKISKKGYAEMKNEFSRE